METPRVQENDLLRGPTAPPCPRGSLAPAPSRGSFQGIKGMCWPWILGPWALFPCLLRPGISSRPPCIGRVGHEGRRGSIRAGTRSARVAPAPGWSAQCPISPSLCTLAHGELTYVWGGGRERAQGGERREIPSWAFWLGGPLHLASPSQGLPACTEWSLDPAGIDLLSRVRVLPAWASGFSKPSGTPLRPRQPQTLPG